MTNLFSFARHLRVSLRSLGLRFSQFLPDKYGLETSAFRVRSSGPDYRCGFLAGGIMTHHIALRDAARIVLPFSLFIGLFSHGTVSAAGLAVGLLCVWSEIRNGLRPAPAVNNL